MPSRGTLQAGEKGKQKSHEMQQREVQGPAPKQK